METAVLLRATVAARLLTAAPAASLVSDPAQLLPPIQRRSPKMAHAAAQKDIPAWAQPLVHVAPNMGMQPSALSFLAPVDGCVIDIAEAPTRTVPPTAARKTLERAMVGEHRHRAPQP